MKTYSPPLFNVPLVLLKPTYERVKGVTKKTYPTIENGFVFYGSFKTYGGTETNNNGVYGVEDTANVETYYNPEITADSQIAILESGRIYEILGEPEDISLRHQFMKFKVKRVGANG